MPEYKFFRVEIVEYGIYEFKNIPWFKPVTTRNKRIYIVPETKIKQL